MVDEFKGRKLLAEGGRVVIVGHRADKTEQARRQLADLGPCAAQTADLSSDAGVHAVLHALTQHPAMELAPKRIRVNAASPAVVETPIYEGSIPKAEVASALRGFDGGVMAGRN